MTSAEIVERKRKRDGNNKKDEKVEKRRKEYKVKYVGETGRSAYERGVEHISDYHNFDEGSHLLKHYLACHRDIKMSEMKIGMKIRNMFRSALERQIGEAVAIDVEQRKGMELLNSKSEYNRCQIPRITTRSAKEMLEEKELEVENEKKVTSEIRKMKMMKKNKRESEKRIRNDENRKEKKRKLNDENKEDKEDDEKKENGKNEKNEKKDKMMKRKREVEIDENENNDERREKETNSGLETPKNKKSPKKSPNCPKSGILDLYGTKLGIFGGENLTQNGQDTPPPPAVGTLEVPCLEEMQSGFIVKSPEKKEIYPPGSWDIGGPMPGRSGIQICSEKS